MTQDTGQILRQPTTCTFLFFPTEVKRGTSGLVIADRQNGHTMGVSVRGILSLYRLAGKESQLHNKPVAFSVSHDHRVVRLTGWGPAIDGDFTQSIP
jgi:hypothetical protein